MTGLNAESKSLFKSLSRKVLWLIGYNDSLSFSFPENLSNISDYSVLRFDNGSLISSRPETVAFFRDNNYYLLELPQKTKEALDSKDENSLVSALEESLQSSTVCINIAGLLKFNPFRMVPCATKALCNSERDRDIYNYLMRELLYINCNINREEYNDLVFLGGKPHIEPLLVKIEQEKLLTGLEFRVKKF